jgi:hypothetical protein
MFWCSAIATGALLSGVNTAILKNTLIDHLGTGGSRIYFRGGGG